MIPITAPTFAEAFGITPQAARKAFRGAAAGKLWRGLALPVVLVRGQRGGAGGIVYLLDADAACPELRVLLNRPLLPVETPFHAAGQASRKAVGPLSARDLKVMQDRRRVIELILAQPKRSAARAAAFQNVAAVPHEVCGKVERFAENTLRDRVRGVEGRDDASLFPAARKDKGATRCLIAKAWDQGVGLDDAARAKIAAVLEAGVRRSMNCKGKGSTRSGSGPRS